MTVNKSHPKRQHLAASLLRDWREQVQLEEGETVWLYAAIDIDSKAVLHARLSETRGTDPAAQFFRELKEKHRVSDAEFLVDGMDYLTALANTERIQRR